MLPEIPYQQIAPTPLFRLAQTGAVLGNVPVWDGLQFAALNPVRWFNAGTDLGRISEVNITGNGVFSSVVGNRATLNVSATLAVNGSTATAMNFGAGFSVSVSSGVASIVTTAGTGLLGSSGNGLNVSSNSVSLNMASQFSAGAMPNLNGNSSTFLNGAGFFSAPPSSGGITGISVNGAGLYTNIDFAGNVSVSGNTVTVLAGGGGSTTLTHHGFGSPLFTGSAPSYLMKGIRNLSPSSLQITDTGQTIDFSLTSGGATIGVMNNNSLLGAFSTIDFQNFASVQNIGGGTVRVFAPSGGSGGITSLQNGTNTTAVNLGGGVWRVDATSGGGGGTMIGIRKNGLTVGDTGLINFYGAGLGFVGFDSNGLSVEILGGGGGVGITGVSVNFGGNYQNINFAGNVSVSGNTVTVLGSGGGGALTGVSGNGLAVTANTVSLAMASTGTAGAMPALTGNSSHYLAGNGTWQFVPSGGGITSLQNGTNTTVANLGGGVWQVNATAGGGGVTSITSGIPSVLQVTPTTGNVVITPTGLTTSYTPTWDLATRTLGVLNFMSSGGILTNVGTTFLTIPSGGTAFTLPYFNGSAGSQTVSSGIPSYATSNTMSFALTTPGQLAIYGSALGTGSGAGVMAVDLGAAQDTTWRTRAGLIAYSANNPAIIAISDTPNVLSLYPGNGGTSLNAGPVVVYMQVLMLGIPYKIALHALS